MQSARTKAELQQHKTKVGHHYHWWIVDVNTGPQLADSYSELLE